MYKHQFVSMGYKLKFLMSDDGYCKKKKSVLCEFQRVLD